MPAMPRILGLHHVTAITSDAQKNIDFYAGVLGLKLVKASVNGDDPTSLHLYYGDEQGRPGSLVTFFVYPGTEAGEPGHPQIEHFHFQVRDEEMEDWEERLRDNPFYHPEYHDDNDGTTVHYITQDADGLMLTLGGSRSGYASVAFDRSSAPLVTFLSGYVERVRVSVDFLSQWLGARLESGNLDAGPNAEEAVLSIGTSCRLALTSNTDHGRPGAGTVHHVAFRIATDDEQAELHAKLAEAGVNVSPIIDRFYFKSIYFREPGGILLEVATDGPGFAVDEPPDRLGRTLCLPPSLEPRRAEIERALPRFTLPTGETIGGN